MTNKEAVKKLRELPLPKLNGNSEEETERWLNTYIEPINMAIKELEQTRWIPVSERLPEIHQDVLLSLRSLDVEVGFRGNTEPYYYFNGDYIEPQNVLAWMPLPKHYKSESEDKE